MTLGTYEAQFVKGDPVMLDYTPGSAVDAGDVVVVGDLPLIAHQDIAANALGALAAGGGVYKVTADAAIAAGKKVWWNNTAKKVTETSAGNEEFGYLSPDSSAAADGDVVRVLHKPAAGP